MLFRIKLFTLIYIGCICLQIAYCEKDVVYKGLAPSDPPQSSYPGWSQTSTIKCDCGTLLGRFTTDGPILSITANKKHKIVSISYSPIFLGSHDGEYFDANIFADGKWKNLDEAIVFFPHWKSYTSIYQNTIYEATKSSFGCQDKSAKWQDNWPYYWYGQRQHYYFLSSDVPNAVYKIQFLMKDSLLNDYTLIQDVDDEWWGFNDVTVTTYESCKEMGDDYYWNINQCTVGCSGQNKYKFNYGTESYCLQMCSSNAKFMASDGKTCLPSCESPNGISLYLDTYLKCTPCPSGTFTSSKSFCDTCSAECATCESDATNCKSCAKDYFNFRGKCIKNCPGDLEKVNNDCVCSDGKFESSTTLNTCSSCSSECSTCSGDAQSCLTCLQGFFSISKGHGQVSCVDKCPDGMYGLNGVCNNCDANCKTCNGSSNVCTSCNSEANYLDSDTFKCITSDDISKKSFFNMTNGILTVFPCNATCGSCSLNENNCVNCDAPLYLRGNNCVESCMDGEFMDDMKRECLACSDQCITCEGNADHCTACPESKYLFENNTCGTSCDSMKGFFPILNPVLGQKCLACDPRCTYCDFTATNCTYCDSNSQYPYLLMPERMCSKTCAPGRYTYGSDINLGYCSSCDTICKTCVGTFDRCTSCEPGSTLEQETCNSMCNKGSYENDGDCVPCAEECSSCSSLSKCFSCSPNFLLVNNEFRCVPSCEDGYFLGIANGIQQCFKCSENCKTCNTEASICTSCMESQFLQFESNMCVDNCDHGFITDGSICHACDSKCSTCKISTSTCTSCIGSRSLVNSTNECTLACPDGSFSSENICMKCQFGCSTCALSMENCFRCDNNYMLVPDLNACVKKCPIGYYSTYKVNNNGGLGCLACNENCNTCNGTSITCTSCPESQYLTPFFTCVFSCHELNLISYNNMCVETCSGFILAESNTCYDKCPPGYEEFEQQCVPSCPIGYKHKDLTECARFCDELTYFDIEKNTCLNCNYTCSICSAAEYGACDKCLEGYAYMGVCQDTCPPDYQYFDEHKGHCVEKCSRFHSNSTCIDECPNGMVSYLGECLKSCPLNAQFNDSNICTESCSTLATNDTKMCTEDCWTIGYYNYKNQTCVKTCPFDAPNVLYGECSQSCPYASIGTTCYNECPSGWKRDSYGKCNPTGECDEGTSRDPVTKMCNICEPPCNKCYGSTNSTCLSCKFNLVLHNDECLEKCPSGFFRDVDVCKICDYTCLECNGKSTHCTNCPKNNFLIDNSCIQCNGAYKLYVNSCLDALLAVQQDKETFTFTISNKWLYDNPPTNITIKIINSVSNEEIPEEGITRIMMESSTNQWIYKYINMYTSEILIKFVVSINFLDFDTNMPASIEANLIPTNEFLLQPFSPEATATVEPSTTVVIVQGTTTVGASALAVGSTVGTGLSSTAASALGAPLTGAINALQGQCLINLFDKNILGTRVGEYTGVACSSMLIDIPILESNRRMLLSNTPSSFFRSLRVLGPMLLLSILISIGVLITMRNITNNKLVDIIRSVCLYSLPLVLILIFYDAIGLACLLQLKYSFHDSVVQTIFAIITF